MVRCPVTVGTSRFMSDTKFFDFLESQVKSRDSPKRGRPLRLRMGRNGLTVDSYRRHNVGTTDENSSGTEVLNWSPCPSDFGFTGQIVRKLRVGVRTRYVQRGSYIRIPQCGGLRRDWKPDRLVIQWITRFYPHSELREIEEGDHPDVTPNGRTKETPFSIVYSVLGSRSLSCLVDPTGGDYGRLQGRPLSRVTSRSGEKILPPLSGKDLVVLFGWQRRWTWMHRDLLVGK